MAMETMTAMTEREARLPCNGAETNKVSTDCSDIMRGEDLDGSVSKEGEINNHSISPSLSLSSLASLRHFAAFLVCFTGGKVIDAGDGAGGGVGGDGDGDSCDRSGCQVSGKEMYVCMYSCISVSR